MRAHIVDQPGPPEVIRIADWPNPEPRPGHVLIAVKAFGLNRSELYSRQGHSGTAVTFPRVLGIECVGTVIAADDLEPGTTAAAAMGDMGRAYDGGYAQRTLIPRANVFPLDTDLPWDVLGALPETYLTAHGAITESLDLRAGQTVLVRGATSSVGLAALSILKHLGVHTIGTTRRADRVHLLRAAGADEVLIDDGAIGPQAPQRADAAIELVGSAQSLPDTAAALKPDGTIAQVGYLADDWAWAPPDEVDGRRFVHYSSHNLQADTHTPVLQAIVDRVGAGDYRANIDTVFDFGGVVTAHRRMEDNAAAGKLVVLVD